MLHLASMLAALALAAPADQIAVQGALRTQAGPAPDGPYAVVFRLYGAESGGAPLYEAPADITVADGAFTSVLAGVAPALVDGAPELWVAVKIGTEPELPRSRVVSVPFALVASRAHDLACSGCIGAGEVAPEVLAPYATTASLSAVATSGKYSDLKDKPDLAVYAPLASLAPVATSGAYDDLSGRPDLSVFVTKADPAASTTAGDANVFASDEPVSLPEPAPNLQAWVPMKEAIVAQPGALRVRFEATINSGPDWFSWALRKGDGSVLATGSYAQGLDPSNTQAVHTYRLFAVDVSGLAAGDRLVLYMKSCAQDGSGFGTGVDQTLSARRLRLSAAVPDTTHRLRSATFLGELVNAHTIRDNDGGYAQLTTIQSSADEVFEVVGAGTFGLRFKKAGSVLFTYDQDIIYGGGNYAWVDAIIGGTTVTQALVRPTGGSWDGVHVGGAWAVQPGSVLTFKWAVQGGDITSMDNGAWSRVGVLWMGQP